MTLYPFHRVAARAKRSVVTLHDLRTMQPQFYSKADAAIIKHNVQHAAALIVSWPHPYRQVLQEFPEAAVKTALIPLPVFHAPSAEASASEPEDDLLLYPSATAAHKNHGNLVEAMSYLPRLRLTCPGPLVEPQATVLAKRVSQLGIGARVNFPGFVPEIELQRLFAVATAVVVPSMWEAASGAVFEAFAWGLPVACADVPPLRAQVEFANADVVYFDPKDGRSMAQSIQHLIRNRDHYASASRRAGERLAQRTWAGTARDYAAIIDWVANGESGAMPRSSFVHSLREVRSH